MSCLTSDLRITLDCYCGLVVFMLRLRVIISRYDGIYKVVKYWPEQGKSKFIVWRFLLRRDDPAPAPWTKEGRKRIEEGGWGEVRKPINYEEATAEKMRAKAAKLAETENASGSKKARGQKRKGEVEEGEAKREKAPAVKFNFQSNLLKAMDSDKVNKRLWGEIQSKEFKTRKELVDFAEELLQCQFCMSIVTHPVTTHCSHSFCKSCLQRGFQSQYYTCSVCRADIRDTKLEVYQEMRDCLLIIFPGYED